MGPFLALAAVLIVVIGDGASFEVPGHYSGGSHGNNSPVIHAITVGKVKHSYTGSDSSSGSHDSGSYAGGSSSGSHNSGSYAGGSSSGSHDSGSYAGGSSSGSHNSGSYDGGSSSGSHDSGSYAGGSSSGSHDSGSYAGGSSSASQDSGSYAGGSSSGSHDSGSYAGGSSSGSHGSGSYASGSGSGSNKYGGSSSNVNKVEPKYEGGSRRVQKVSSGGRVYGKASNSGSRHILFGASKSGQKKNAVYVSKRKPVTKVVKKVIMKPVVAPKGGAYQKVGRPSGRYGPTRNAHGNGYFPTPGKGYFPSDFSYVKGYRQMYTKMPSVQPLPVRCPYGWLSYGGHCYYFSRDKQGWFQASMKCGFMGGYLAVVDEPHENTYLKLIAKKYGYDDAVWIGLNDILFSQIFVWEAGNKQCKYWDWFTKEPNFSGIGYRHCVALGKSCGFQWQVNNCMEKNFYVCEMTPGKPCTCNY